MRHLSLLEFKTLMVLASIDDGAPSLEYPQRLMLKESGFPNAFGIGEPGKRKRASRADEAVRRGLELGD